MKKNNRLDYVVLFAIRVDFFLKLKKTSKYNDVKLKRF